MHDQRLYERLKARIRIDDSGCWLWTGGYWKNRKWAANRYGYISTYRDGKSRTVGTHRAMWIALHGPLTPAQCVCHKCDVPLCINPDHLWIGTLKENIQDSKRKGRHFLSAKTHCKRGHPLSGENLYVNVNSGNMRHCKQCCRERHRRAWQNPEFRKRHMERQRARRRLNRPEVTVGESL